MTEITLKYPKPEGNYVIVPTEPTPEMLNAYDEARAATTLHPAGSVETYNPHQSYWALLNAAPKIINSDMDIFPKAEIERMQKALQVFAKTSMGEVRPTRHEYHIGWQDVDGQYGPTRQQIEEAMKVARAIVAQ